MAEELTEPKHVAVAVALSARFLAVLAEGWRFAQRFRARLTVLHCGERTEENAQQFQRAFAELGIPMDIPVICKAGEPSDMIVEMAKEHPVDLLLAGALERESAGKHFLGNVARSLIRNAPSSVLLFTQPTVEPQKFKTVVVATDFSDAARHALRSSVTLARIDAVARLIAISVTTPFTEVQSNEATDGAGVSRQRAAARLEEFARLVPDASIPIETRLIDATTGFAAHEFVQSEGADLLVVPAAREPGQGSGLPSYMDWVLQVIPCNLWVVKQPTVVPSCSPPS